MSKHLVVVTRRAAGRLVAVPVGELALTALARLPGIRNIEIERENRSGAGVVFEIDDGSSLPGFKTQLEAFGLTWCFTQRLEPIG